MWQPVAQLSSERHAVLFYYCVFIMEGIFPCWPDVGFSIQFMSHDRFSIFYGVCFHPHRCSLS